MTAVATELPEGVLSEQTIVDQANALVLATAILDSDVEMMVAVHERSPASPLHHYKMRITGVVIVDTSIKVISDQVYWIAGAIDGSHAIIEVPWHKMRRGDLTDCTVYFVTREFIEQVRISN